MAIPSNWPQNLTDLANRCMQKLGEKTRFTDIATDTADYAVMVRDALYDIIRDAQVSFDWPELRTKTTISTPDSGFTANESYPFAYRFALPDDYLREVNRHLYAYEVEGGYVYADRSENLPFHYVRYEEDVTKWSPQLFKVVLYRLASEVAMPITQSPEILQIMEARRSGAESEARRMASYNKKWPNGRQRGRGLLAQTRNGERNRRSAFYNE